VVAVGYRGEADVIAYLASRLNIVSPISTLLISGEEFSRPHILIPFLTNLTQYYPDLELHVIFYLRRFDHLLESVYAESVKRNLVGGVEKAAYELNFVKLVRPAVEKVGVNNVIVRPYNKIQWHRQMLGADFLHSIGIGDAFEEMALGTNEDVNVSLSRICTFILSCLPNKEIKQEMLNFFQKRPLDVPDVSRYFMSPQRRNQLNLQHLIQCRDFFAEIGIKNMAEFLGIEEIVQEPGWTPFVPDRTIISEYMREFVSENNSVDLADFMNEVSKRT
jgi:hypothetical protein